MASCAACQALKRLADLVAELSAHVVAASNQPILDIDDVATLYRCRTDKVRRISPDELPVYRGGKRNLYLCDEVVGYLRTRRIGNFDVDNLVHEVERDLLKSQPDGLSRRTQIRRTS